MPRATVLVDKAELEREISKAESEQTFGNLSKLFEHLSATPWAKGIKNSAGKVCGLSPSVIYLRVKQFKIEPKTKAGERGAHLAGEIKRTTKRFGGDKNALLKEVPAKFAKLANKVVRGSLKSAVKLKCLECCCWQPKEVTSCHIKSCPLWGFLKRKPT